MGHRMDLGTINAHDRRVRADDWSSRAQMGNRWATGAPLPSILAVVDPSVDNSITQPLGIAIRASVMSMRVAANTEPRRVPAIFE